MKEEKLKVNTSNVVSADSVSNTVSSNTVSESIENSKVDFNSETRYDKTK